MIRESVDYLGYRVRDKVTGFEGVCISVNFDLFGCIQCAIVPRVDSDGKTRDSQWYDIARLERISSDRVMELPPAFLEPMYTTTFSTMNPQTYDRGPAEKPAPPK